VNEVVRLAHGSGGGLSRHLLQDVFLRYLHDPELLKLNDSAVLPLPREMCEGGRLAFTTDAYVVSPLEFPGGDIAKLAVYGTVNDLASVGARPLWLSVAWVLEEGLPLATLERLAASMASAAERAGVRIVTGDTKVVPHGLADGAYCTSAGVGIVPPGREVGPSEVREGDAILVNGTLGDHGMAVMMRRQGIELESDLSSDCAPLSDLVEALLQVGIRLHCLRDATRGGAGGVLCEIAQASGLGIEINEASVPVRRQVAAACEILGLDPLFVANEGKMLAFLPAEEAERALAIWREAAEGREATVIGRVTARHPRQVVERTVLGGGRIIRMPAGELLPRIC